MTAADRVLVIALAAMLLLMAGIVLAPGPGSGGAHSESALPGEPRDLDVELLRRRILAGELSDREALYYERGR